MEIDGIETFGFDWDEKEQAEPVGPCIDTARKATAAFCLSLAVIVFCGEAKKKKRVRLSLDLATEPPSFESTEVMQVEKPTLPIREPQKEESKPIQRSHSVTPKRSQTRKLAEEKNIPPLAESQLADSHNFSLPSVILEQPPSPVSPIQAAPPINTRPCTEEDQQKILEIVDILSACYESSTSWMTMTAGGATFLAKIPTLLKYKTEIAHVHPFDFLLTIFQSPERLSKIKNIWKGQGITRNKMWSGFMDGVNEGMNREKKEGNLLRHVESFASKLGSSANEIEPFIRQEGADWEIFVTYLIGRH